MCTDRPRKCVLCAYANVRASNADMHANMPLTDIHIQTALADNSVFIVTNERTWPMPDIPTDIEQATVILQHVEMSGLDVV
jgi:hypothetical protein